MEPTQYKCDPYRYVVGLLPPLLAETLHTVKDFFLRQSSCSLSVTLRKEAPTQRRDLAPKSHYDLDLNKQHDGT